MSLLRSPSSRLRPVFTLDEAEGQVEHVQSSVPRWSATVASSEDPHDITPNTTPRLGASWSPFPPPASAAGLTPAEVALAAFEASRYRRKRSLTLDSCSTASSSSLSTGEYEDYLTPDTSVASISPCSSPVNLEPLARCDWSTSSEELERCDTVGSSNSSTASSDTFVFGSELGARSASFSPSAPLRASRPLLVRCLTAPTLGCGMVRSISTPVATQEAHDALLRNMRATLEADDMMTTGTAEPKRHLDDVMGSMRLEQSPSCASLPWPYNRIAKVLPDQQDLRPARPGHGSRPSLSRSITFDTSCLVLTQ